MFYRYAIFLYKFFMLLIEEFHFNDLVITNFLCLDGGDHIISSTTQYI